MLIELTASHIAVFLFVLRLLSDYSSYVRGCSRLRILSPVSKETLLCSHLSPKLLLLGGFSFNHIHIASPARQQQTCICHYTLTQSHRCDKSDLSDGWMLKVILGQYNRWGFFPFSSWCFFLIVLPFPLLSNDISFHICTHNPSFRPAVMQHNKAEGSHSFSIRDSSL